ncbi:MAG: response regulator [Coriobacteriia bacterium]|nr:response regulator [Coriobacteriia bacterium]
MQLRDAIVIDDSKTMRTLISFALTGFSDSSCQIRQAANGVEGLERLAEATPDLIVVDINMPEMNGLEFIENVRRDPSKRKLPIVVITTEGSDEDIRRGMQAGATEYLVKPFQPQKLFAIIERLGDRGTL